MYQVDNQYAVLSMPSPGAAGPNPDGFFKYNTPVSQAWINAAQQELVNVVTGASLSLDKSNFGQLLAAIQQLIITGGVSPGIGSIVEDTNPHLGGNLKLNGFNIISIANGNIVITANGTGFISLNATNILIGRDLQHRGDTDNLIRFDTDIIEFRTGGASRIDISTAGVRLGAANVRVNAILDQDNMSSDSAVALITQQSAKAYADAKLAAVSNNKQMYFNGSAFGTNAIAITSYNWFYNGPGSIRMRRAGTISNFYTTGSWNSGAAGIPATISFTLQVNGVDATPTVTLTPTTRISQDLTHSVAVNAGDDVRVRLTTSGAVSGGTYNVFYGFLLT